MKSLCNKILLYVYTSDTPIHQAEMEHVYRNEQLYSRAINELTRLNIISENIMGNGDTSYIMIEPMRIKISTLPKAYTENPYDYFFEEEQRVIEAEAAYKWYLQQDAKQRFDDYPKIKKQRNTATIIAVLSLIATIVLAILKEKISTKFWK